MLSANIIYNSLARYDERIKLVPREDVIQEILYSICIAGNDNVWRIASRQVYKLLSDYGYSRKKGKDRFDAERLFDDYTLSVESQNMLRVVRFLYVDNNYTAKEVCRFFGAEVTPYISKMLSKVFKKGGSRAGMKQEGRIPFSEKTAREIMDKYCLSEQTFRTWKYRGYIPAIYVKWGTADLK